MAAPAGLMDEIIDDIRDWLDRNRAIAMMALRIVAAVVLPITLQVAWDYRPVARASSAPPEIGVTAAQCVTCRLSAKWQTAVPAPAAEDIVVQPAKRKRHHAG